MLPKSKRATSILECFLKGGFTPWETFYCVPEFGINGATWHHAYPIDFANAAQACGNAATLTPFAAGPDGRLIYLSPFVQKLIDRPDVTNRMRVVVNRHDLGTHEGGIPLAITGSILGSRSMACLGAHVARYSYDHDVDHQHVAPFAYAMAQTNSFNLTDNLACATSVGLHPGIARPLLVAANDSSRLQTLLARGAVGGATQRTRFDALQANYLDQYRTRLDFPGASLPLRAPSLDGFASMSATLTHNADLQALLPSEYLTSSGGSACFNRAGPQSIGSSQVASTAFSNTTNYPAQNLKLAAHLLTHSTSPATHCFVLDTGLREADGGGGYDTHVETPFTTAHNLLNFLDNLLALVNQPGEGNPNKIDLDETMIILNTEFGRTIGTRLTNTGRDNWQHGYVQIYIGGPVQKGVSGVIGEDGYATSFSTPAENRIAALLAMGIWPFDDAGYSSGQVQDNASESVAVRSVLQRVLGVTV